jgi:hypothetical protein
LTVDGLNVPETRVNVKKLYKQGVMLKWAMEDMK